MVLKNTQQLLSDDGEALFVSVYDSPYFYIYNEISKSQKWGNYMKDVKNMWPVYFFWPNLAETYKSKANNVGLQVVSCEIRTMQHEYIPYLFWRSVNPYLQRINNAKEQEKFVQELHETTMNFPEILPNYPLSWSKLLIVHLRKM